MKQMDMAGELTADWDADRWVAVETLALTHFRDEGGDQRPAVRARLGHGGSTLCGIFHVNDRYVRSVRTGFQADVCNDSCVEFFFEPAGDGAYFNFEFSAGGAMLCHYVRDIGLPPERPRDFIPLSDAECEQVRVVSSLPPIVEPEITEAMVWTLAYRIPLSALEPYAGELGPLPNKTWRANFYKCGSQTSHPHYGSWMPVSEKNFHMPECFGDIVFE
ncbi:MAG: carbohydrate-binding family 9-like protein [Lentisphaerae bacterium]|nr:carbohydrate-binding family 9-like protein [Lentisphaerota bacterium]